MIKKSPFGIFIFDCASLWNNGYFLLWLLNITRSKNLTIYTICNIISASIGRVEVLLPIHLSHGTEGKTLDLT